jgi:hypothetical protein
MQGGMEVQFFDRRDMSGKDPHGQADPPRRREEVDPKTRPAHRYGIIQGFPLLEHTELFGVQELSDEVVDFLMRPPHVGVKLDDAMLPPHHRMSAGEIDIRHGILDGIDDDILESYHGKPPAIKMTLHRCGVISITPLPPPGITGTARLKTKKNHGGCWEYI